MNIIKSKGGYFYKEYKNGKKRISKIEYDKLRKKHNKKGGSPGLYFEGEKITNLKQFLSTKLGINTNLSSKITLNKKQLVKYF